jgi:tetratricopeptide (TPR) repeat protein
VLAPKTRDPMDRIEEFKQFIASRPEDPMPRYALAMELKNRGQLEEAVTTFQELISVKADFPAAYQQGGMVLVKLGRKEEAKEMYKKGIIAAEQKRDFHTKSELEAFLDELE